jgi:hypothetical protein
MAYELEGNGLEVDGVKFGLVAPTITEAALKDYYLMMNPVMLTKQEVEDLKELIKKVDEGNKK